MDQTNLLDNVLFKKVIDLSKKINSQFCQKGIAIPVKNDDGSITLGNYTIIKNDTFFAIKDYSNQIILEKINLPQTAILLANSLALGKFIDKKLIDNDQRYGYALFEEKRYGKKPKKKDLEKFVLFESKLIDAKLKKGIHQKYILDKFVKFTQNI